jgi:hypothetical protein
LPAQAFFWCLCGDIKKARKGGRGKREEKGGEREKKKRGKKEGRHTGQKMDRSISLDGQTQQMIASIFWRSKNDYINNKNKLEERRPPHHCLSSMLANHTSPLLYRLPVSDDHCGRATDVVLKATLL